MDVTGISSDDPIFGAKQSVGPPGLDKDAFLELLVSQLENQDPLEPTTNEQFVSQLATFSSLEQLENLNSAVLTMTLLQQGNALLSQLTSGSALLGKTVHWTDPQTGLEGAGVVQSVKVSGGTALLDVGGQDVPLDYVTEVQQGPSADGGDTE